MIKPVRAFILVLSITLLSGCYQMFEPVVLFKLGQPSSVIVVKNETNRAIVDLRAGPCCDSFGYATNYSDSLLPAGGSIPPNGAAEFMVSEGFYSIRAVLGAEGFLSSAQERFVSTYVDPAKDKKVNIQIK